MTGEHATPTCDGLRVVDFSQGMAGPLCTMILADNGADVVKVEPPGGDWARGEPGFRMWNRGKRSVVLNLKDPDDRQVALELVAGADVVVEAYRPGVAERLGIGDAQLRERSPALIYCSIRAQHVDDERAVAKAYEANLAAGSGRFNGLDHLNGAVPNQDRDHPIYVAAPLGAYGAAQLAVQGILAALLEREATGRGRRMRTSLTLGATAFLMRQEMRRGNDKAPVAPISDAARRGIELCFMTAECRDGKYIQMCARQDHHFRNWLTALGLIELLDDPRFAGAPMRMESVEDVERLDSILRTEMRRWDRDDWMRSFTEDFDVGADPFLDRAEFLAHPDMTSNDRVVQIDDPEVGLTTQVGPIALFSESSSTIGRPAPRLGEHDLQVRRRATESTATSTPRPVVVTRERPLAGLTILEVAYFIAGPLATTLLAEMGARVIKVEPPAGDPYRLTGLQSAKFLHGKESIVLDLKQKEGVRILHRLAARSDAFIHSFRPGVPDRLGLDYSTLRRVNPRLVYLYAASYGSAGPQRLRSAFHSTPTALSGGGILQAGRGNPPVDDSYPDPGAALGAATAMLLGLFARERTGVGQYIETTMLTSTGYILSNELVDYDGAPEWALPDRGQHGLHALYRLYPCAEGWLFVAVLSERDWQRLADALAHRDWLEDARFAGAKRRAHDDELAEAVAVALRDKSSTEWETLLRERFDLAVTAVYPGEFEDWLEAHDFLYPAQHALFGSYWCPDNRVRFDGLDPRRSPAAAVGEHSVQLLHELGLTAGEVHELVASGVVGPVDLTQTTLDSLPL